MNQKVKEYINRQPSPQKEICLQIRKLLLATIPDIDEDFKNGVPWYGKFYIAALKNSVNVGFSITGLKPSELKRFHGQGKFMRHIKLRSLDDIDKTTLEELFKLVREKAVCYE